MPAGRVRVVHAETIDDLQPGEILVAKVTDVGYTPAFAYAAAVVTELGGPTSHAAIVAREFGVPCVVNARGATARLVTGTRRRGGRSDGRGHRARLATARRLDTCHIVTVMDFAMSAKAQDYHQRLTDFMVEFVFPAEHVLRRSTGSRPGRDDHTVPPVVEELKKLARDRGLWNLFLPSESGLTNLEYAPLAELSGWSMELAPEALNCAAPDTGNMETLHLFATEEQSKQWLEPLLNGEIRSAFAMTEPAVASSDARNIETTMLRDGGDYVINGRKWWTSGANDPRCKILIVMGRTNPDAASHQQQSMILVPIDTPGVDDRAVAAGVRLAGPARARRDRLRQRAGAGDATCSARRAAASRSPRPASVPAASTTACGRSAWPSGRWP